MKRTPTRGKPSVERRSSPQPHRRARARVEQYERSACAGRDDADKERGPFTAGVEIGAIEPVRAKGSNPKLAIQQTLERGTRIVVRARPDLTAQSIERPAHCHVAYVSRIGHDMPALAWSPLAVRGITMSVSTTEGGYVLVIESDDDAARALVDSRARALQTAETLVPPGR